MRVLVLDVRRGGVEYKVDREGVRPKLMKVDGGLKNC